MHAPAPPTDPSSVAEASLTVPEELAAAGLSLLPEYVSAAEEAELLAFHDSQEWDSTVRRRTQRCAT